MQFELTLLPWVVESNTVILDTWRIFQVPKYGFTLGDSGPSIFGICDNEFLAGIRYNDQAPVFLRHPHNGGNLKATGSSRQNRGRSSPGLSSPDNAPWLPGEIQSLLLSCRPCPEENDAQHEHCGAPL